MENNEKLGSSRADLLTEVIEAAKEEIKNQLTEAANDEGKKRKLGEGLREEVGRKKIAAEEFIEEEEKVKRGMLRISGKQREGNQVLTSFTKVIEAIRSGLEPEFISLTREGAIILKKIAEQKVDFTPSAASSILFYFGDFLLGEKNIIDPTTGRIHSQLVENFSELKKLNPIAARIIKEALKTVKEENILSISNEEFEKFFSLEETRLEEGIVDIPPELKANLPLDRPEIKETTEAILSPENFLKYLKKHQVRLIEEKKQHLGRDLTSQELEQVNIELSEYVERVITDLVSELYNKADASPDYRRVPFHEVESIGYFQSLQTAYNTITTKIQFLGRALSEKEGLEGISFFSRFSEKKETQESIAGKEIINTFINPLKKPKKISTADFFMILNLEIAHIRELREFTHNARIVFRSPSGGDQSPWAQLANYANRIMTTSDFDMIAFLPHSEVYQDALNIYNGLLQAELAKHDWILDPKLFVAGDDGLNDLERETLTILKEKYKGKKNEYQINSAFSIAQGVSMAILLTEPETIANADPNFKQKSTDKGGRIDPTYLGEWLSDTVVTGVLNPFLRGHLRWLTEGTVGGPLGFLPIPDPKLVKGWQMGIWDHNEVIKDIENFHRRFFEGRTDRLKKDHLTLFDIRNPGRIGSFATRGGWRLAEAYKGLLYDYKDGKSIEASFLDKWRRLENVGFEPWLHFFSSNKDVFFEELKNNKDFRSYIYNKYFQRLFKKEEDFFTAFKGDPDAIYYSTTIEFLVNRLPTKIITEERNRFSDGGRIWEVLRTKLSFDFPTMDQAVKDLVVAQSALRQALSDQMRRNDLEGKDIGMVEGSYILDEETVEQYLKNSGIVEERRITNVKELLKQFRSYFLLSSEGGSKYRQWIEKIKGGRSTIPFALAPEETDYRYLTLRSSGVTTIKRFLGDTANVDKVLTPSYGKFLSIIHSMAISGKKDLSELVKFLHEIKVTLTGLHGKEYANEIVCYFAYLAISYFKKDTFAKPLGGLAGLGQKTSIAAEFAGAPGRVWEWDSRDIGRFIFALEQAGVLEKEPYELQKEPSYEPMTIFGKKLPEEINLSKWLGEKLGKKDEKGEVIPVKFFGKEIKIRMPKVRKKDFSVYSDTLKKMAGGEFIHKLWDAINTVIPIALAVILIMLIQKAFKEAFEQKK